MQISDKFQGHFGHLEEYGVLIREIRHAPEWTQSLPAS
jgi:hypothetical protein